VTGPRFFAEALAEYEHAVVYYEKREEGLGARLIQEFDEAVALALEYPEAFATVQEAPALYGLRWVMLRSFRSNWSTPCATRPFSWLRCSMRAAVRATGWKGSTSRGADLPISRCRQVAMKPRFEPARRGTRRETAGSRFSKNLRLVRGKVASRKEVVAPALRVFDSRRLHFQ
jgi:hypothetical protein